MAAPDSTDYQRARLAFAAYSRAVGGVSAVTGDRLPAFEDTNEIVQLGWIAAATAVEADVLNASLAVTEGGCQSGAC